VAQLVAQELQLELSRVTLVAGDTAVSPVGGGTHGSRSITVAGASAIQAARSVKEKILRLAADELEASPGDLELSGDRVVVRGAPETWVAASEVAHRAYYVPQSLPTGEAPGLEETGRYVVPDPYTFTNGCHVARVAIDEATGRVSLEAYVVVQDCGTVVNPLVVEGQIRGGVAQGVGSALLEELIYDEAGQNLTTTWMDYLMPSVNDVPPHIEFRSFETPSKHPGGMKGMGEAGLAASPTAIALAIEDALRDVGGRVRRLPVGPEDVLAMLGILP
jgi:carbon-monoxide dehydrogenase large subunit